MKFLVDNALSPELAQRLSESGHNSVHVRDAQLGTATDDVIFAFAADKGRVIISADTDFGTILALRNERKPSVILLRRRTDRRPLQQALLILSNLAAMKDALESGCIAVFDDTRIRIRELPVGEAE